MTAVEACRSLAPDAWNRLVAAVGTAIRFSQRSEAVVALDQAFPEYSGNLLDVEFDDGARILVPSIIARRRFRPLSSVLAMPLGWDGSPIVVRGALQLSHLESLARHLRPIGEFRIHGGFLGTLPTNTAASSLHGTHVLDLAEGFQTIWEKRFTGKNRNTCRKAERRGVVVERVEPERAVDLYYRLYTEAAKDWGYSSPPYPRPLFEALGRSGYAEFWLGYLAGNVVGGAVFLIGSRDVFYWSGAMDRSAAGLSPSNLVLKRAIEDACIRGFDYVDFGASEGLPRVRKFKETFGARPISCASIRFASQTHAVVATVARLLRMRR